MRKQVTLVLSGYYGFDNAGDEAVLLAILQQLQKHHIEAIVLSGNPDKTTALYGVKAVDRRNFQMVREAIQNSNGLISGGGSLLQDITSARSIIYYNGIMQIAQFYKKPVFCYAQGIGPLTKRWLYPLTRFTLNRSAFVSVRDTESKQLLLDLGVKQPIGLAADPVLGIAEEGQSNLSANLESFLLKNPVTVSLRPWQSQESVVRHAVEMVEGLQRQNLPVLLLPFHHPHDTNLSYQVLHELKQKEGVYLASKPLAIHDIIRIVKASRLVIGMRLHALVFAASQSIPFVGISYDPKIDAFLELYGRTPSTDTDNWQVEQVLDDTAELLSRHEAVRISIQEITASLHERIQLPIEYILQHYKEEAHDNCTRNPLLSHWDEGNHGTTKPTD